MLTCQNALETHDQIPETQAREVRSRGLGLEREARDDQNRNHNMWNDGCMKHIETMQIYWSLVYMRVVLNSFIWKTSSSPKKNLSPNFRELHVFLSRYMLAKIFKKNVDVWYPQIVPGVWSLVTLHSAAAVQIAQLSYEHARPIKVLPSLRTPSKTRPVRPQRCLAEAWETQVVTKHDLSHALCKQTCSGYSIYG